MKVAAETRRRVDNELDMATIRRRVARIKSRWTPEIAEARAAEGARRRRELDTLVCGLMLEAGDPPPVAKADLPHGLSLVG